MDKNVVYKSREEDILMKEIASSSFITLEQLGDIKKYYDESVPYHNFLHALTVAERVLELWDEEFNIIEIRSLFLAALFHDAWHSGTAEDLDEFRSLDIAFENIEKFEQKYNYEWIDFSVVRKAIIGTVFKNRSKNKDKYAQVMADVDIHPIGLSFCEFLYYADFAMALEIGQSKPDGQLDIEEWFSNISYFKFLMWVNKEIFINKNVRKKLLNNSLSNIKKYLTIPQNNYCLEDGTSVKEVFAFWKNNDATLEEFSKKFFK